MLILVIILLVLGVFFGVFGLIAKGLFWLFIIGCVLFVAGGAFGLLTGRHRE